MILLSQTLWKWTLSLEDDAEYILRPRPTERIGRILSHRPPPSAGKEIVDVNNIALGIEYTGRFPVETGISMTLGENHLFVEWDRQRENVIQDVAKELSRNLGGTGDVQKISGGHGHNLGYSYNFLDGKGRSWRVDWDGIQRSYDDEGKVVQETVTGGHLEVATAKFTPRVWEIEAVYKVFKKVSYHPFSYSERRWSYQCGFVPL